MTTWNDPWAIAFGATYLLDLTTHFYYLKNAHLNKLWPRLTLTFSRAACLLFFILG